MTTEPKTTLIGSVTPKREWLLRCSDSDNDMAVCAICVSRGDIEIWSPDQDRITLSPSEIADFHAALHEAIDQVEIDLRQRQLDRAAGPGPTPSGRTDT